MKGTIKLIAALLAVLMLFTACSGGGGGDAATGDGGSGDSGDGASSGPVTLRMIESLTSASRTAILREIADEYEALHPDITIEIISPPVDGADEKVAQMLMAGETLDIVEVREQTINQFSNNAWITPLDDYVTAWDEYGTLTATAKDSLTLIGGQTWMVPYGFYQRCLFYRKDLFEAAGLDPESPPTTYAELLEYGEKLTNPAENRYGYAFRGGNGGNQYFEVEMLSYIGYDRLADPNAAFYLKDGDGATVFTLPEAKEALEYHKDLYEKASPSDSVTWASSEMVQGFMNGTAAMLIQDSEVIIDCQNELSDEQWGTAPMPIGPSGQSVSPNGYAGWGVTSYSKHTAEAADFVLFLSNSANNTKFAKSQALVPIHSNAVEDTFFKEGPFSVYMDMAAEPDVFTYAMRPQMYLAFASYKVDIDQEFQKYLMGELSADDLLAHLDKYWSDAYEEEGQLW